MIRDLRAQAIRIGRLLSRVERFREDADVQRVLLGSILAREVTARGMVKSLRDAEFRVFSQFGDDGIIHYLTSRIDPPSTTFIEFGVADYVESNTRFLLMSKNWSGYVMDASQENVRSLHRWFEFWKFDLRAKAAFIDRDNINELIAESGFPRDMGLLHIDLDGNDYWIWECIDVVHPVIVIVEYNSVFGIDRSVSIPYDKSFRRTAAHYSNLYCGASLRALYFLAEKKGYAFVGCNSAGNNAYFVRRDYLVNGVREISLQEGYVESKFRESRSPDRSLTYLRGSSRLDAIKGLPIFNLETMSEERL